MIALAERLKAPVARTSRAKDFLEHANPYDVGMTGVFGAEGGYHALMGCDTLLLSGCDFAWRQFYPDQGQDHPDRHDGQKPWAAPPYHFRRGRRYRADPRSVAAPASERRIAVSSITSWLTEKGL